MSDTIQKENSEVFHNVGKEDSGLFSSKSLLIFTIVIIIGVVTGYFLSKNKQMTTNTSVSTNSNAKSAAVGTVYGSNDLSTFKDTATGVLQQGGIKGEGQYHLVRTGGDSQNVYITSSIVDLSQFIGKKIKVNGQTQKAQYAGWLMDVGRVEVVQ